MYEKAQTLTARAAAGVLGAVMAVSLVFGAFVPSTQAQTLDELMAQIAALQAQLTGLQGGSTTSGNGYVNHPNVDFMFNVNLTTGSKGNDVMMLQKALNDGGWTVATSGPGSKGMESTFFGPATKAAVAKFQVAKGITPAVGYFGPLTRAEMNKKGAVTGSGSGSSTVTGDKLVASEGDTPDDMLVAEGQLHVPTTVVEFAAGDDDVMIKTVTLEVTGSARDGVARVSAWHNGMFLDDDSVDSNDEAELKLDLEVGEGDMEEITFAVNMTTDLSDEDGQDFELVVIEVATDGAAVEGLPVSGAEHTANDSLVLDDYAFEINNETGEVQIGDEEELLATVNVDSGASDDSIFVKGFRLEQVGDIQLSDLKNIVAWVDGDEDETVDGDVDGDFVTFMFDDPVELEDGEDMDFEIYADIVDGSGDTISFDIDDVEIDLMVMDEDDRVIAEDGSYTYDGDELDVTAGTGDASDSDEVSSGNIAVGEDEAELASFELEVEGEDITGDMVFNFSIANAGGASESDVELDNFVIVDENGDEIASADDTTMTDNGGGNFDMVVEFDDVTFPQTDEMMFYIIKADVGDEVEDDTTYTLDDIEFSDFEGEESGDEVADLSPATVSIGTTQTVKGASLAVGLAGSVDDDSVKDDQDEVEIAQLQLDASESGESIDVKNVTLTITLTNNAGVTGAGAGNLSIADLSNCALYDGDERVSDEEDFSGAALAVTREFDLDDVVVMSEDVLSLSVRCDINQDLDIDDTIVVTTLGTDADADADVSDTVTPTLIAGAGTGATVTIVDGTMTAQTGAIADDLTARVGQEIVLGSIELKSNDVSGKLEELTLMATGETALLDASRKVTVWDGSRQVANAFFTTGSYTIETWMNGGVEFEDDETVELTLKAKLASSVPGASEGDDIAIDVDGSVDVEIDGDTYDVDDTELYNDGPIVVYSSLPKVTTTAVQGQNGSNKIVAKFAIMAEGTKDLEVADLTLLVSQTAGSTDADSGVLSVHVGNSYSAAENAAAMAGAITVSKGTTKYFVVKGDAVDFGGSDNPYITISVDLDGQISVVNGGTTVISPIEGTNIDDEVLNIDTEK